MMPSGTSSTHHAFLTSSTAAKIRPSRKRNPNMAATPSMATEIRAAHASSVAANTKFTHTRATA